MKTISFLEYFKNTNLRDVLNKELFNYHEKVSQPFSFEKVVELFEDFYYLTKYYEIIYYKAETDETSEIIHHFDYDDENIFCQLDCERDEEFINSIYDITNNLKPKTIDEFIVLCNNLNIELQWKQ
jgi:hypothetical protein